MKRLILLFSFILILMFGCNKNTDTISITANPKSYTPTMSSIQGITMTPNFKSDNKYKDLVYHWTTEEGEFLNFGKEVKNLGESVLWWAVENDEIVEFDNSCEIKLEVIDGENQKILVEIKLMIVYNDGFYEVEE